MRPHHQTMAETKRESKRQKMKQKESEHAPERKFRAGGISATIWLNKATTPKGEATEYRTISLERSYLDKEGQWQATNSFRINDLPKAVVALQQAFQHLVLQDDQQVIIK